MKKAVKKAAPKARREKRTDREVGWEQLQAVGTTMGDALDKFAFIIHLLNSQWWKNPKNGRRIKRNKAEQIALIHSELSEALEAVRKDAMDSHLVQWRGEEIEMADAVIRIFDYAAGHGLNLGPAIIAKLIYNYQRADHKPENRVKRHGKKF